MFRALLLLLAGALGAGAADWREQVSPATPGAFPLLRPVRLTYRCGWAALGAGEIEANFSRRANVLQLEVKGGTTGFVRTLWRIDATHTARAGASSLLPLEVKQLENYGGKTVRTELQFDPAGVVKFRETKPEDKVPPKRKRFEFPNLYDMHSALLFVRSQRLKNGDVLNFVTYPAGAPFLATARVLGRERVESKAGRFNAIKLDLKLQRIGSKFELAPHGKFKRATVWLSDDADRILVKAQAEIFVGSVWVELASVQPSGR